MLGVLHGKGKSEQQYNTVGHIQFIYFREKKIKIKKKMVGKVSIMCATCGRSTRSFVVGSRHQTTSTKQ